MCMDMLNQVADSMEKKLIHLIVILFILLLIDIHFK